MYYSALPAPFQHSSISSSLPASFYFQFDSSVILVPVPFQHFFFSSLPAFLYLQFPPAFFYFQFPPVFLYFQFPPVFHYFQFPSGILLFPVRYQRYFSPSSLPTFFYFHFPSSILLFPVSFSSDPVPFQFQYQNMQRGSLDSNKM